MTVRSVPLGDLCEVTPSPSSDLFTDLMAGADGTPVVTPADITDAQKIDTQAIRCLRGKPAGLERYRLRPRDLVIVRLGGVGRLALLDERARDWVYHSSCIRVRPNTRRVDPVYLAAYLAYSPAADELLSHTQVGTVPVLATRALETLPVALPSAREQRRMSAALSEVALQMDLHFQMLDRLDSVRQGLFARILGDDFPGAGVSRPTGSVSDSRTPRTRRTNRMS